jgi:glycosyltransferase involved in cell wall biosynthesis/O-antigen/teichoic acid export membrane protein
VTGSRLSPAVRIFLRQTVLLLLALGLLNGSNYVFHIVVSRLLGPTSYGALAALLAVVLVLSIPFSVLQTALAEKTATLRAAGRERDIDALAANTLKTFTPFAWTAGAVVLFVGAPLLSLFLHVGLESTVLLAPYVVASVPISIAYGVLQGRLRLRALAALILLGVGLRLALGVSFVVAGLGIPGALLGTVLATALPIPIAFWILGVNRSAWARARRALADVRGELGAALYGLTSFWILAEFDIALARHYLGGQEAGYYSSAAIMARALLFLPAAVGIVAFPRFVEARTDAKAQLRWLRLSVAAVGILGLVGGIALTVLREPLITLAFGDRYLPGASLIPVLAIAMACLAVVNVLVYFHIAVGSRAYLISVGGVVVEAALVAAFHANGRQIAIVAATVCFLVALFQYQAAASIGRWQPRLQRLGGADPLTPALWRPATLELSVVLPCHNAAAGLRSVLTRLLDRLDELGSYEIIVVSDGSTDQTVEIADSVRSDAVHVIDHPVRGGKGHALQLGLSEAKGAYVAFCDADGDIEAEAIQPFVTLMKLYEPDIVLGSKRHPLSEVHYPSLRRYLSWVYHKLARVLFRVDVSDTQTGFKLIRRDVLAAVLPRMLEKRYAFDLEFLVVARTLGYSRVLEAPVRIHYRFASQVDPRAAFGIFVDTLAIFYRHYILNTYRAAGRRRPSELPPAARLPVAGIDRRRLRPDDPRRLLFINWRDLEHPEAGGAEVFTHEVARRWVEQGHDVTLLTSGFRGAPSAAEIDGVRIRRLGTLRSGSFHAHVQRELMRLDGFDLIVEAINTIPFLTPLYRYRLPPTIALIYQLAVDVWDAELPKPAALVGRGLERSLLRLYRDVPVATISNSTRDDLLGLGFAEVTVVAPGVDDPPDLRGVTKESVPTFVFVGRLAANKRPEHAVAALREIRKTLPTAQLWLIGQGPQEQALARALPDGATLLGRLSRADLYERLARADCLLVPSVREGWGLVVVEANSVGTPAVGYDVAGIRDSIRDGRTGLLAAAGDPQALAAKATALVVDRQRYEAMQRAAVAWAGRFSWDATAVELLQLALGSATSEPIAEEADTVALLR